MEEKNYFTELYEIDVSDKVEKKGDGKSALTYLSWAWAWAEVKKRHPNAYYTIYENKDNWNYHTDGRTAWVKTGVTINGLEHIEYLPVMNNSNKSIPLESVTSFDVNKAIQRSLTKACARHGLGLYVYAGEDLPEGSEEKYVQPITKELIEEMEKLGVNIPNLIKYFNVDSIEKLTVAQAVQAIASKRNALAKQGVRV